jgi:hypothetical protein
MADPHPVVYTLRNRIINGKIRAIQTQMAGDGCSIYDPVAHEGKTAESSFEKDEDILF